MKKIIIITVGIIILAFLAYLIYYFAKPLQIIKITPGSNDKFVGLDTQIMVEFDRKYWLNRFDIVVGPEITNYKLSKKGNKFVVTFSENLKSNQTYNVNLSSNITVLYESKKTKNINFSFTTAEGLTEELYDANLEDYYQKYPLTKVTPYQNEHFGIDWPNDQGVTIITLNAIFNAGVNGPPIEEQEANYKAELSQYKQEALDWIKSKGVDPDKIQIQWSPSDTP